MPYLILLLFTLSAFPQVTVTRNIAPQMTADGEYDISLEVAVQGPAPRALIVNEELPPDWIIRDAWRVADGQSLSPNGRWLLQPADAGTIRYRVRPGRRPDPADFSGGSKHFANSDEVQEVTPDESLWDSLDLQLSRGWNLYALPFDHPVFARNMFGWQDDDWTGFDRHVPALAGVWHYSPRPRELSVAGIVTDRAPAFHPGWNVIGPAMDMTVAEFAPDAVVWAWLPRAQRYRRLQPEQFVRSGSAYWVFQLPK